MSEPQQSPDDPHWLRSNRAKHGILGLILTALLGVGATLLTNLLESDGGAEAKPSVSATASTSPTPPAPESTASPEPTEVAAPTEPPPTTASPWPSGSPTDAPSLDDQIQAPDLDGPAGPEVKYLQDMRAIERRPYKGTAGVAGTTYTASIWKDMGPNVSNTYVVYALDGEWSTFVADVGPRSTSSSDAVMDFEVYVDDRKVGQTYRTTVTKSAHIEVKVTGGIQLRLVALHVSGTPRGSYTGEAVWGSARLEK